MTADHRSRIRAWWKEQFAGGAPIDLDAAAEEATQALIADPAFMAAIAESLIKPLVRDIGQKVATRRPNARAPRSVQLGSQVMSREQAVALVDAELAERRPHWSRLVQRDGEPAWFMALSRDELMAEAKELKRQGLQRLKEASFLASVGSSLDDGQIVSDRWTEHGLEELYMSIGVQFKVGIDPKRAQGATQLSGATPASPSDTSSNDLQGAHAA